MLNQWRHLPGATNRTSADLVGATLLYTCAAPMAFLAEQAGGTATTGTARLLDRVPTALDERVPMYLGETVEVERLIGYIDDHEKGLDAEVAYPLFHHRSLFID